MTGISENFAVPEHGPVDKTDWHALSIEAVLTELNGSEGGLSPDEAKTRLERYGPNEIEFSEGDSAFRIFLEQYKSVLIWVLLLAAGVMAGVGHMLDAGMIIGIVVFITIFGFLQDYRAEQSIQSLRKMATREALVIRNGIKTEIDARTVVPGDIIALEAGDIIPADARLIDETNLSVNESTLTGESLGVSKNTAVVAEATPVAERSNLVYKDTIVERGSGIAVVVGTGANTEIGDIAIALEEAEERDTPFQSEMNRLGKVIAIGVIGIVSVIALTELVIGDTPPLQVFLTTVGIAVSAVPEGLPAVVTLSLALGARRLVSKNALVRRLPIVEALGSVDVICTDKTGTLTEEEMTVQRLYVGETVVEVTGVGYDTTGEFLVDGESFGLDGMIELLRCGILCNSTDFGYRERDGEAGDRLTYIGSPTEIALFVVAEKAGLHHADLRAQYPRIDEIEFSSDRKRMTTIHSSEENGRVAYMKGAPEVILDRSSFELNPTGDVVELTASRRDEISVKIDEFAGDALRVMGFAYRTDIPETVDDSLEHDFVFLGLQGILDPPRAEVPDAIAGCLGAGITVIMITGDNAVTAQAIGREIGLKATRVITGPELDNLDDTELAAVVDEVDIFARTTPGHKTRILKLLQSKGHTVAMTGDGVNDAPAVKNADVGVSMGIRGTDVTEQASDMVLLDDNFATIRDAVQEGRRIFDNVRKFVNYLLSGNGGEVTVIFTGAMAGFGLVITPIQILWINVVTDGIPALTMGVDPAAEDVMERKPRPPEEGVITKRIVASVVGISLFMTVCLLPIFTLNLTGSIIPGSNVIEQTIGWEPTYEPGRELAQTMVFTGFVVMEIVRIQAIRFRYGLGIFSNIWLLVAIGVAMSLQLTVLYTGLGQLLFGVEPLQLVHWIQIGIATTAFAILMSIFVVIQDMLFEKY